MESESTGIAEHVAEVRARIESALGRSGRRAGTVTLVAVSKTFPAEAVRRAFAAGVRDFGENRAQELAAKAPALSDLDIVWHMIGHLQTNKVRTVLPHVTWLHSLDRPHLAAELVARLAPGRSLSVLLQVNTTGEASKSGVEPGDAEELLTTVRRQERLDIQGLMTIGPLRGGPDQERRAFVTLRELRDRLARASGLSLPHLSMGMSGDFEIAIEEGATIVRVGSRIFGSREAAA